MDANDGVAEEHECPPGSPQWMATFADLSTLLMSFFVLLLAFSEMDAARFKELSGALKNAFGVQEDIPVDAMAKGTSIISREFRPGRPDPTLVESIRQFTVQTTKNTLKWLEAQGEDMKEVVKLIESLAADLEEGALTVEWSQDTITIHINEKASFDSGSADLKPEFVPVLHRIRDVLAGLPGDITVAGHTDNIPIATSRFRSNWELSASRAVSVAHELLGDAHVDDGQESPLGAERFTVVGHADTQPVDGNDTTEGRAANRRVDVQIQRVKEGEKALREKMEELGSVIGEVVGNRMTVALPEPPADGPPADDIILDGENPVLTDDPLDLSPYVPRRPVPQRENRPVPPAETNRPAPYDNEI
jgi:chemotaxis protein MotB